MLLVNQEVQALLVIGAPEKVHQLLSGYKMQISPTGLISQYSMQIALRKLKDGIHIHILLLLLFQNQNLCIEHLHTLSNNPSTNTSIFPVNQFLYRNLHLLHILPLVADLHKLHQTTTHGILICHIILVGTRCLCLLLVSPPSRTLSFS